MIKARASGSKVYLYFMKKGRQARHRIPRNSCYMKTLKIKVRAGHMVKCLFDSVKLILTLVETGNKIKCKLT